MGLMQLLDDETYRELVHHSVRLARGHGEILVGVGDTSFTAPQSHSIRRAVRH